GGGGWDHKTLTSEAGVLPLSPRFSVSTAALAALVLSACTTGGTLTTALESAAAPDAALPETVDVVPQHRDGVAMAAAKQADDLPGIQPAGYAGPTPSRAATVFAPDGRFGPEKVAARSPELDALIARYAQHYAVPEELVRRV